MTEHYVYTDPDGRELSIGRCATTGAVMLLADDDAEGMAVCLKVPPKDLDGVVAAMYRAEGRTPDALDAARLTTLLPEASDERIAAFLARFEIRERTDDLCRAGAFQAGGDDV